MTKSKKFDLNGGKPDNSRVINMTKPEAEKAIQKSNDVEFKSMEEERLDYLERQAAKYGIKSEDTQIENKRRVTYNQAMAAGQFDPIYSRLIFPEDFVLVKLFRKPIESHLGRLIPDLIKVASPSGNGEVRHEPNLFPYLNFGVIVNCNSVLQTPPLGSRMSNLDVVTLTNDFNAARSAFFLVKLKPDPNFYEGYALIHRRQIETVMNAELLAEVGGYKGAFKIFTGVELP